MGQYLWLAYLLFYFAYLVLLPATLTAWMLSLLAVAVFLPLYLYGFKVTGTRLVVVSLAIYALGSAMMPVNLGANCFFIYAAAFIGFAGSPRLGAWWLVAMLAGIVTQGWAFSWPLYVSVPTFIVAGIIGATNINVAEFRRGGRSCGSHGMPSSRWRGSPSASGSAAISTICSATRCRSSC